MNRNAFSLISVCLIFAGMAVGCAGPAPVPAQPVPAVPDQPPAPAAQAGKPNYTPSPNEPYIFFLEPLDGDNVSGSMAVRFGVSRLDLTGKRVFLVVDQACAAPGETLTEDAQHLAYKQGRDRLALEVGAGQHRLCLQVANNSGIALDGPGMVQVIDIVVE